MRPSPSIVRIASILPIVLIIAACGSTTAPSASVADRSPSPSTPAEPSPSTVPGPIDSPSVAPSTRPAASEEPTVEPTVEPSGSAVPDATPVVTPKPLPSPTAAPDCGTGEAGYLAATDDGPPATLAYGRSTLPFVPAAFGLIDGSYDGDDAIPVGAGADPKQIAVVVAPGDHVILRAAGLTISRVGVDHVDWASVSFAGGLASWPGDASRQLNWRYRSDGSISVDSPNEPGDYFLSFVVAWHGDCRNGDGVAYGHLKVVAP